MGLAVSGAAVLVAEIFVTNTDEDFAFLESNPIIAAMVAGFTIYGLGLIGVGRLDAQRGTGRSTSILATDTFSPVGLLSPLRPQRWRGLHASVVMATGRGHRSFDRGDHDAGSVLVDHRDREFACRPRGVIPEDGVDAARDVADVAGKGADAEPGDLSAVPELIPQLGVDHDRNPRCK